MSIRLKVGFVGVLSCLMLVLGLFSSTGVASAHSTQAVHSQTSVTSIRTLRDDPRRRHQTCRSTLVSRDHNILMTATGNGCHQSLTCSSTYVSGHYVTVCHYTSNGKKVNFYP